MKDVPDFMDSEKAIAEKEDKDALHIMKTVPLSIPRFIEFDKKNKDISELNKAQKANTKLFAPSYKDNSDAQMPRT